MIPRPPEVFQPPVVALLQVEVLLARKRLGRLQHQPLVVVAQHVGRGSSHHGKGFFQGGDGHFTKAEGAEEQLAVDGNGSGLLHTQDPLVGGMGDPPLGRVTGIVFHPPLHAQSRPGEIGNGVAHMFQEDVAFNDLDILRVEQQLTRSTRQGPDRRLHVHKDVHGQAIERRQHPTVLHQMHAPILTSDADQIEATPICFHSIFLLSAGIL